MVQFGNVLLVGAYVYVSERFARHNFAWDDWISSARGSDRDILKGTLGSFWWDFVEQLDRRRY